MSFKSCLLLLALVLASATLALGVQDPELEQCQHQCRAQQQFDDRKVRICVQRCEDYVRAKHGGEVSTRKSPIERLRDCNSRCEKQQGDRRQYCQSQCQQEYEREIQRYEGPRCVEDCSEEHQGSAEIRRCVVRCEQRWRDEVYEGREAEQGEGHPYVFKDQHFFTGAETQHGRVRILQKFTDRSELLRGIENFRLTILEAQPQTFIVPNHWDAECVVFVANGRGTVSLVWQDRRESFNIKQGDIFRIRAGTTTYLINSDNNERLVLAKLLQPVNTPGEFQAFFGGGGENPESFYRAFSNEILEAAFNTRRDRLERLFGQQKQGVIIKASPEQIRSMSHHEEGGIWPFGGESKGTHNLYEQRPVESNQYGQLYLVDSSQFRQLRDLNIAISLANITQGAMTAPHYNSKATKIAVVVDGEGYFEMACPHLSQRPERQRETKIGTSYQTVRSRLTAGTVVVIPAGHPYVAVASNNRNLQVLCFEVNAYNNEKFTLAGKRNVMNQLEREAKELAFGLPAREVDDVFRSQQEEFFFRGPQQQQREGRSDE